MPASRIHVVRHGEVENPDGILYGRLPGFHLSSRGREMAALAAAALVEERSPVRRVVASPLERARESAEPIAAAFGLPVDTSDGLIEASSRLEGGRFDVSLKILARPAAWRYLVNPFRPSWGEPFVEVAARMRRELELAADSVESGDVVLVSHQLPIWMLHRSVAGRRLFHDPRKRRCTLSSITTFEPAAGGFSETGYREPARELLARSTDVGAV